MNTQEHIQEILKEADGYGLRNEVEDLAKSFIVDSNSAENKKFNFVPMEEAEAYEIAYNLVIME